MLARPAGVPDEETENRGSCFLLLPKRRISFHSGGQAHWVGQSPPQAEVTSRPLGWSHVPFEKA